MPATRLVSWSCSESDPMANSYKTILPFTFLLANSMVVLGQTPPSTCANDSRPGVRAYCKDLNDFQNAVNRNPAMTVDGASGWLNKLDFSHAAATNKFITATAPVLVLQSSLSKFATSSGLQGAGQARPDRQLGSTNNASGTTSLIS